jgi:hypothetical protein
VKFVFISGLGANVPPTAMIDSITPNPALYGEEITFSGHGIDSNGDAITGYSWRSSINGQLSNSSSFKTSVLYEGNHIIFFKVMDEQGAWSEEVSLSIQVTRKSADPNTEHIYICLLYFSSTDKPNLISFLQSKGAYLEGDVW